MDLKDQNNKDSLLLKIDELFEDFSKILKTNIDNGGKEYKKSALLYYWLRDYKNYIKNEKAFDPKYLPEFTRGSVVNINFGFNVGSEFGGLHYAIVLANSSPKNPNLIVLPLKSLKKDITELNKHELFLGNELYNRLYGNYIALYSYLINLSKELIQRKESSENRRNTLVQIIHEHEIQPSELLSLIEDFAKEINDIAKQLNQAEKNLETLNRIAKELKKLKTGSVAQMSQIQTISKMRVQNPTNKQDILYGIKVSSDSLQAIDKKICEIYTNIDLKKYMYYNNHTN